MDDLLNAISSVGFPIVMCVYNTVVLNKTLENLKVTIDNLTDIIKGE